VSEAREEFAIEARGLSRRFGAHIALDALDLCVPARSTYGLLGANGAGKTTFLRVAIGALLPSAGRIAIGGVSPAKDPVPARRGVGFAAETSCLYPELSVIGFLRFVAGAHGLRGTLASLAIDSAIERFQLGAVTKRRIGNLSKGFQQRVSLAQSIIHDPALVIVDEPSNGLDPLQRAEVWSLLSGMRGERTVLICTHDLDEARALTSRVAILFEGRRIAEGPTERVLEGEDVYAMFRGSLLAEDVA
jgi:ABC-2 type transport system ATP-binding protein